MKTNVEIDDVLMAAAMRASGVKTKREAVERGFHTNGRELSPIFMLSRPAGPSRSTQGHQRGPWSIPSTSSGQALRHDRVPRPLSASFSNTLCVPEPQAGSAQDEARSEDESILPAIGMRARLRLNWKAEVRKSRGKLDWIGDLEAMRTDK